MAFSVALNLLLTVVEVVVGILSGSLALIADAVHNLGDVGALVIAWVARRIARKEADDRFHVRLPPCGVGWSGDQSNVVAGDGGVHDCEAIDRFLHPQPIETTWVILAAGIAVVVDLGTVLLLWSMSKGSLNIRAAFVHNLTDAAASIAVVVGALFVREFGWLWVDPALCLMIAAYIVVTSVPMLRHAAAILMNHVPRRLEVEHIRDTFLEFDEIFDVHHVHLWEIDERTTALEAHIVLSNDLDTASLQPLTAKLRGVMMKRWKVAHTTFEYEPPDSVCTRRAC
ncbi:MAG: cation diffusion facilitator family transporter [bacterium]